MPNATHSRVDTRIPDREPRTLRGGPAGPGGFTLVELLVVVVLAVLALGTVARTLSIQGEGFQQQTSVARSQSNVRLAIQILAGELKEIAATDGDLIRVEQSALTVRSMRKVGVVCDATRAEDNTVDVWVLGDDFTDREGAEDSLLVFLHHEIDLATDDEWVAARLSHVEDVDFDDDDDEGCGAWGGSGAGDTSIQRLLVDGGTDLTGVAEGSPIRSFEHFTYALESVDGVWALTRREGDGTPVALVDDLAPPDAAGLVFAFADTAGQELTIAQAAAYPGSIGSIAVTARSRVAGPTVAFDTAGYHEEALSTSVYLRNNHVAQTDPPEPGTFPREEGGG